MINFLYKQHSPVSSLNCERQKFAQSLGALCKLLLAPVQERGRVGRACRERWPPAVGHAVLYRVARSHSAEAVQLSVVGAQSGRDSLINAAQNPSIHPLPLHHPTLTRPVNLGHQAAHSPTDQWLK